MANINVVISPSSSSTIRLQPNKTVVSSVQIGPKPTITLGDLTNVNASNPDDGEALIYDGAVHEYVVKPIVVNSNNITSIQGGSF